MNVVGIIPARGGSKSIPNKNLLPFCGKPLLRWSIDVLRELNINTYVTSDSENILFESILAGASIIKRPNDISGDI